MSVAPQASARYSPAVPDAATISAVQLMLDSGCTVSQVADALGISESDAWRLPELATTDIGPINARLTERAAWESTLPGTEWAESVASGEVVRLERYRRPDIAAAKALLAAHLPERYGQAVPDGAAPRTLIVSITCNGKPVMRIGQVYEADPAPGLNRQAGGGGTVNGACVSSPSLPALIDEAQQFVLGSKPVDGKPADSKQADGQ